MKNDEKERKKTAIFTLHFKELLIAQSYRGFSMNNSL